MSERLQGKKILIITANNGIERDELIQPLEVLGDLGASMTYATCEGGEAQTMLHDTDKDRSIHSDARLAQLSANDFDALVIPGGTVNADTLRQDQDAQRLVREFAAAGKTVAAICHGPWLLVDAGVLEGKSLTSYPSVRTDLVNAGAAQWVDETVKCCPANGWTLITSRTPKDLVAFNETIAQTLEAA